MLDYNIYSKEAGDCQQRIHEPHLCLPTKSTAQRLVSACREYTNHTCLPTKFSKPSKTKYMFISYSPASLPVLSLLLFFLASLFPSSMNINTWGLLLPPLYPGPIVSAKACRLLGLFHRQFYHNSDSTTFLHLSTAFIHGVLFTPVGPPLPYLSTSTENNTILCLQNLYKGLDIWLLYFAQ